MLTQWKKEEELDFLNDVSSVPLQQGLRHLQTAFTNFFAGRTSYPNFKKKRNGRWYISIRFDEPTIQPLLVSENSVGIDLGTTSLMATSNGDKIANPKHFNKHRQRLKKPKRIWLKITNLPWLFRIAGGVS
jgi:putative transposase